ncbi:hypothetical protein MKZ38_008366 [Zalerion maritima]|uniref:Uncharacterized protein n=1 Tax=Zalerion maritima TaxID=339359 RepID=A0AAD5WTX9_9PEZI|nr:hypothetical protein MKZ38_008366 [Zalerion maritima]
MSRSTSSLDVEPSGGTSSGLGSPSGPNSIPTSSPPLREEVHLEPFPLWLGDQQHSVPGRLLKQDLEQRYFQAHNYFAFGDTKSTADYPGILLLPGGTEIDEPFTPSKPRPPRPPGTPPENKSAITGDDQNAQPFQPISDFIKRNSQLFQNPVASPLDIIGDNRDTQPFQPLANRVVYIDTT